jgi:sec-independent protein translocase protein TatC
MDTKQLTVLEHMEELRKRLFITAIFFVITLFVGFYTAKPIIKAIQLSEQAQQFTLNASNPSDPLTVYLSVAFLVGIVLVSPILLFQLWLFITPGLHDSERKATLKYIPYAFFLFLGGIAFSYYVLFPNVMRFMVTLSNDLSIETIVNINEYFSFLFKLVIPFGFIFQLPVLTLFLARIGILNPDLMVKFRKYSYFALFVIAVMLAPPDLISNILIAVPLFILYEASLVIARIGYRKFLIAEEMRAAEEKVEEQNQTVEALLAEQRRQIEQANL